MSQGALTPGSAGPRWWRPGARWPWRWGAVLAGVALLAAVPPLVAAWPAGGGSLAAAELLARVRASAAVAYQGYAESRAGLGLPDVPRAERVVALLGETTRMRAWVAGPDRWRVDELTPIGERGLYQEPESPGSQVTWAWDSGTRQATMTTGEPAVRLARPADLLPPELGRRLAVAAAPGEASPLPARRVAGVRAEGLRLVPRSPDTTVGRVDLWAEPRTGLPVRVEVTARGASAPVIATAFLDLRLTAPHPDHVTFQVPPDAEVRAEGPVDVARALHAWSPFALVADPLAGLRRRTQVAAPAATYGEGFAMVAVLALLPQHSLRTRELLARAPVVEGPWGQASLIQTPLLNGMVFDHGGVSYALAGTVPPRVLERVAAALAVGDGIGVAEHQP